MYAAALVKKRSYCPKVVPGDLIDAQLEDKEAGDVLMIDSITEYNKLFKMFCMKDPDCMMKIMASCVTLDAF